MFNLAEINVVSLNVNGIRNETKRRTIFNYLKHDNAHIVLLQETHSSPEIESVWSNEWGSKIIYSHGSNFSRGVAVMFAKNFPVQVDTYRYDAEGRYLGSETFGSRKLHK